VKHKHEDVFEYVSPDETLYWLTYIEAEGHRKIDIRVDGEKTSIQYDVKMMFDLIASLTEMEIGPEDEKKHVFKPPLVEDYRAEDKDYFPTSSPDEIQKIVEESMKDYEGLDEPVQSLSSDVEPVVEVVAEIPSIAEDDEPIPGSDQDDGNSGSAKDMM
jgi:hypothetical protein